VIVFPEQPEEYEVPVIMFPEQLEEYKVPVVVFPEELETFAVQQYEDSEVVNELLVDKFLVAVVDIGEEQHERWVPMVSQEQETVDIILQMQHGTWQQQMDQLQRHLLCCKLIWKLWTDCPLHNYNKYLLPW
jgi:hypothetical protein